MKKSRSHLKILFLYFCLLLLICFGFLSFCLKANAATRNYYFIENDGNYKEVIYTTIFDYQGDYQLIYSSDNSLSLTLNYQGDKTYYANNDSSKPIYADNALYCIVWENGINHAKIYSVDIPFNFDSYDDIIVIELFTISGITAYENGLYMYSQGIQFAFNTTLDYYNNSELVQQAIFNRYNTNYFNNLREQYGTYMYNTGKIIGKNEGYELGYEQGLAGENAVSPFFRVLTDIFSSIGSIFAIELVPNIPLGLFILVPLFFAVLGLILWIWRRN